MVSAVRRRPGQLECTVAMACDTDGTRILLFHNLPISQKLSASYELSGEEKRERDSLSHNLLLKTASHAIFYFASATQQTPGPNGWIDNSTGSNLQHCKLE